MRAFEGEVGQATLALGQNGAAIVAQFRYTNGLSETEGLTRLLIAWLGVARAPTGALAEAPRS